MPTIVVDVMPKAELLDPQGKAVAGVLIPFLLCCTCVAVVVAVVIGGLAAAFGKS